MTSRDASTIPGAPLRDTSVVSIDPVAGARPRYPYADNVKVLLIVGVIVGHATPAWTGIGVRVFDEPHVREPLLSILMMLAVVGAMFAMPLFFLVAGAFTPASLQRKGTPLYGWRVSGAEGGQSLSASAASQGCRG